MADNINLDELDFTDPDDRGDALRQFPKPIYRSPTQLVKEARDAYDSGLFIAALTVLVTIPDVCATLDKGGGAHGSDYINWCIEYAGLREDTNLERIDRDHVDISSLTEPDDLLHLGELSGRALYQLRCACLHNGSAMTTDAELKKKVPYHIISVVVTDSSNRLVLSSGAVWDADSVPGDGRRSIHIRIDLRALIDLMDAAVDKFIVANDRPDRPIDREFGADGYMYEGLLDARGCGW